ncbi:MAG: hypothetical protein ACI4F5_06690 [Acutalibacteraceae bacterium]
MSFISKILVFFTVLFSMIMPGDVNKAPLTINKEVKTTDSVIEYTYTNETGYVISNDCWVEKLEVKNLIGDGWTSIPVSDYLLETAFEVYPGKTYTKTYDAGALLPGTYRITIGYNVITGFDGSTTTGYSSAEFDVTLN